MSQTKAMAILMISLSIISAGILFIFVDSSLHKEALRQECESKGGMMIRADGKDICLEGLNKLELEKKWKK